MNKITRLLATAALLFGVLGGVSSVKAAETKIHECDYASRTTPYWGAAPTGSTCTITDGVLVITNTVEQTNNWDLQRIIDDGISTIYGNNYKVRLTLKCSAAGTLACNLGNWGSNRGISFDVTATEDFVTRDIEFNNNTLSATDVHVLFQAGKYIGTVQIKKVEVFEITPNAPTKTVTETTEVDASSGSTMSSVPVYASIKTEKEYDKVFVLPFDYVKDGWEKLVIVFEEAPGGDFLFMKASGNYDHFTYFNLTDGTEKTLELNGNPSRTDWNNIILYSGGGNAYPRYTKIKRIYFSKGEGVTLETSDIDIEHIPGSTNEPTVVYKSVATAVGAKTFEISNVDVTDSKNLLFTFSTPTVGTWTVTYDGTSVNIPEGSSSFKVDVSALNTISTLTLSVGEGTFPRDNNFDKLYLEKDVAVTMNALANDAVFSFDAATGYDSDTKTFSSNGGWTFSTPVDISNYKYLYITTAQSGDADHSVAVSISDNNGLTISGGEYDWQYSGIRGGCMYIDNWNHKNVLCLNVQYLEEGLHLDVKNITSLKFGATIIINNVVLSNYASSEFLGTEQYHTYSLGDHRRNYEAADLGRFGTVCLPYKAIASGAFIYKIASATASGISLERVDGILEAGKPYFYEATDDRYLTNSVNTPNVQFFCVDWTGNVAATVANNGLIGTFSEITLTPNDNYYVLSKNRLYKVDAGATGDKAVKVGANKAYINKSLITNTGSSSSRSAVLFFDDSEATNVNGVMSKTTEGRTEFYNLSGQRVAHPTKGLYIVNGKKVVIK